MDQTVALRRSTEMLIKSEPTLIALFRPPAYETTAAGGVRRDAGGSSKLAVDRFFSMKVAEGDFAVETEGEKYNEVGVLIGTYDDDIKKGDVFTVEGIKYRVRNIHPDRSYQTKAMVVRHVGS